MTREASPGGLAADAPERLRARVEALLEGVGDGGSQTADARLRAARDAITRVFGAGAGDRGAALDVLSADALVTSAIELMAGDPQRFEALCYDAMRQLAEIAPHRD